ncbi:hypothetical protein ARMSODRAFT_193812 [Armillaria solidipes]|uniref:Uncharacterized protein n=1 Tax=Armillaria solidipes TaxID=1076256 RepID=A0A2H3BD65_9AGAR|nr:hypothetical protein ARMSODRAFT_193812 [Armillaria solidipes]
MDNEQVKKPLMISSRYIVGTSVRDRVVISETPSSKKSESGCSPAPSNARKPSVQDSPDTLRGANGTLARQQWGCPRSQQAHKQKFSNSPPHTSIRIRYGLEPRPNIQCTWEGGEGRSNAVGRP